MIESGKVKNQAELVRIKGTSRARVTQMLNILKFDKKIINKIEQIGEPMNKKVITERKLRKSTHKNEYSINNFE